MNQPGIQQLSINCSRWDLWVSWPLQREHCTQTAATAHTSPTVHCSHSKFNTAGPIPPYSSNQWPALLTGDTAVFWVEGDRWETGMALCVCRRDGGWVGGGVSSNQVRLILNHTDNSMLRHTRDGLLEGECVRVSEGVSEGDSWLHRGWDPEKTACTSLCPLPCSSHHLRPLSQLWQWCALFI